MAYKVAIPSLDCHLFVRRQATGQHSQLAVGLACGEAAKRQETGDDGHAVWCAGKSSSEVKVMRWHFVTGHGDVVSLLTSVLGITQKVS